MIGLIDDLDDVALFGGVKFFGGIGGVFHGANLGAGTQMQGKVGQEQRERGLTRGIFCHRFTLYGIARLSNSLLLRSRQKTIHSTCI
jgi:hypothetical protein